MIDGSARFGFELYATPFKPLTQKHWGWRHFHESYSTDPAVEGGQAAGATIFTYHQGNKPNPSALWKWWNSFYIANAEMLGFWQDACPVKTNNEAVKATAYVHRGERVAVAVASWAESNVDVRIDLDWSAVGLDPDKVKVSVPAIDFFQEKLAHASLDSVPLEPNKGWILVVSRGESRARHRDPIEVYYYYICLMSSINGRNIATTIVPTITASITIMIGSRTDVRASTVTSTSVS
jgi:hypothetical protein